MTDLPQDPSDALLANRYQVTKLLGRGGMADVLLARDKTLERKVAIKVLRQDLIARPEFRARFQQEAKAAANLLHPNIVTIYDYGQDGGKYFMVMEYVDGTDLKTLLRRRNRFNVAEALDLLCQACSGVGYAHRAGLVHCDLKPHNLLVTSDTRVKIADFGIARALAAIQPDEHHDIVWGSPLYFSPEQAAGRPPSPASDVYSLGVILYELISGRLPFQAENAEELIELHQAVHPTPPSLLNPEVSPELEQIMLKVLAKETSSRYRTADQFGRVLQALLSAPNEAVSSSRPIATGRGAEDPQSETMPFPSDTGPDVDWLAVVLGLIAFLSLGGLVPLWLYACLLYPSCPIQLP